MSSLTAAASCQRCTRLPRLSRRPGSGQQHDARSGLHRACLHGRVRSGRASAHSVGNSVCAADDARARARARARSENFKPPSAMGITFPNWFLQTGAPFTWDSTGATVVIMPYDVHGIVWRAPRTPRPVPANGLVAVVLPSCRLQSQRGAQRVPSWCHSDSVAAAQPTPGTTTGWATFTATASSWCVPRATLAPRVNPRTVGAPHTAPHTAIVFGAGADATRRAEHARRRQHLVE